MPKAVGIDLGTTNSVVAVLEAGDPVVIPNAEGSRTTPSVVAFSKGGEVLMGEVAKRQAITNPDRTIRSVKRHMGTSWTIDIDGKAYNSQEISARTLQKLKRDAEAYLGDTVSAGRHHGARVLRRRPAHRHQGGRPDRRPRGAAHHQRAHRGRRWPTGSTRRATTRPSSCSTSAAARSTCRSSRSATACSRSSRPTATPSSAATTGTSGSSTGWSRSSSRPTASTSASDNMALQRLKEAAEKAKIELSQVQQTQINLPFITATSEGPLHLDESLSRAKFQELTADLIERCRSPFEQAIKDAGLSKERPRPRHPRGRLDPHARRARPRARPDRARSPTRASTPTRSSPWAPPSRPACSRARSRTCCSSTSPRCRSASRPRAA